MASLTTIITPTLTNEFIVGRAWNEIGSTPLDDTYTMSKLGLGFTTLFPNADKLHMIPNFSYGGVTNAPSTSFQGQPYYNQDPTHDITDNVAKMWGAHTLKFGFFRSSTLKQQSCYCIVSGNLSFGQDSQNPGDTGYAYSNALLGNYQSFSQASVYPSLYYNIRTSSGMRRITGRSRRTLHWITAYAWPGSSRITSRTTGSLRSTRPCSVPARR